ncbi:MAG: D-sedoheptulose-7-phosphate isomerase [Thermodesulfobacteriota bacterium]
MKNQILDILSDSISVKERFVHANLDTILDAADRLSVCLASGHKILLFGNGGSAADAQHMAAEFVNRFRVERRPLAAVALTTDTSILTSIGNDYSFDDLFSKQVQALGRPGDVALGISTSGNSENVVRAMQSAGNIGMITIGFSGRGGRMRDHADLLFSVPSDTTARVQETHILLGHILCELTDRILFPLAFGSGT